MLSRDADALRCCSEAGESYELRMADGPAAALQLAAAAKSITTIFAVDAVIGRHVT